MNTPKPVIIEPFQFEDKAKDTSLQDVWVVLAITGDHSIRETYRAVFESFECKNKTINLVFAGNLDEAKGLYLKHSNAAVAIVDSEIDNQSSALDFAEFVRNQQGNNAIQLLLRADRLSSIPEYDVLEKYNISDCLESTELKRIRFKQRLSACLRTHESLALYHSQQGELDTLKSDLRLKTNELSQLEKIKDNLLSMVSHDLRSPAASIEWLVDVVMVELEDPNCSHAKVIERLSLMHGGLQRIKILTSDLVDSALIKRNEFEMDFETVDLYTLVDELMPNFEAYAKYAGRDSKVQIRNYLREGLPQVQADKTRIAQVITNLVNNAIKFTPSGHVALFAQVEEDSVSIFVEDTGFGIAPEDIDNIFRISTQAKSTRDKVSGGLGLGLFVASNVIAMHKGQLNVKSNVGEGSTFSFRLPL